jgi:hypothetical protein
MLLCDGCTRGFHMQCIGSACLLGTSTAQPVLDPLPLLAALAAARGPMALALRSVYEYYYYYYYYYYILLLLLEQYIFLFCRLIQPPYLPKL